MKDESSGFRPLISCPSAFAFPLGLIQPSFFIDEKKRKNAGVETSSLAIVRRYECFFLGGGGGGGLENSTSLAL